MELPCLKFSENSLLIFSEWYKNKRYKQSSINTCPAEADRELQMKLQGQAHTCGNAVLHAAFPFVCFIKFKVNYFVSF